MLLSGERRYKAIKKLYERGKFTYKTIKGCRVITTRMNETQKKLFFTVPICKCVEAFPTKASAEK